ncbi:hypothetical protein [Flavobacterium branchiicola]|uniref:Uncharacterized protein n=1 Tax=Flavobacterium branchiicola TaxID=1114875 RepID=A0ABV9PIH3_9FLAO|nr:hypothetical protein [Flavobacterium branchiicola]MBS7255982.1 hypothetical protein [Flavobacterium branchiicola]
MKKILLTLLIIQSGFMMAQTKTLVTINGEKVQINPNAPGTADNGLTVTSGNIQLGGALLQPTTLTTTSAATLALKGLQDGSSTDNVLVADANGVLKWVNRSSFLAAGDNLGNHTATTNLDMTKHNVNNVNTANFADQVTANTNTYGLSKNNGNFTLYNGLKSGNDLLVNETTRKTSVNNLAITTSTDGNLPAANYLATSADANGNVVWKSPANIVSDNQVQADWNTTTATDPSYIKNKPAITGAGDNLGNHTATTTLNMAKNNISNINNAYFADQIGGNANTYYFYKNNGNLGLYNGLKAGNDLLINESTRKTSVNNLAITTSTDGNLPVANYLATSADANGNVVWKSPASIVSANQVQADWNTTSTSDPSYIKNKPSITGAGDNLGNHTATTTLNMTKHNVDNINAAYFADQVAANTYKYGFYKNNGVLGLWSDRSNGNDFAINETTRRTSVNNLSIATGTNGVAPAAGNVATAADASGNVIWTKTEDFGNIIYTSPSVAPGASYTFQLTGGAGYSVYTITSSNICTIPMIANFIAAAGGMAFVGGASAGQPYTVTSLDIYSQQFKLTANASGCVDGGNNTQFNFTIVRYPQPNTIMITNDGNLPRVYTLRQKIN